jgi:hypothetical protein
MYDLDGVYKRCGHKLQDEFKITAEEYQAARKIGKKEVLREILEWISNHRKNQGQSRHEPQPKGTQAENETTATTVSVRVPLNKLREVMDLLKIKEIG